MKYRYENTFDYENGFYLTSDVYRMGNMLAHYELYKLILHLPGDVIECGVFKGGSLMQFASFRELLENEKSRKIIGFDAFGNFPMDASVESDKKFINHWNEQFSEEFLSKEDIEESLRHKNIANVELVEGDIMHTVEDYVRKHPEVRIALLHIDTDVYSPAKRSLEVLFPLVVRGGLVVFDDYGTVEGETLAVEEFLRDTDYVLQKFTFSHNKPSFLVKK